MLQEKTNIKEAVTTGFGEINGEKVVIAVMDGNFMMGSMGSVVGEKITMAIEDAIKNKLPLIMFCVSGGARMQEGIISLMQMAKTSAALAKLDEAGLLYISVLTDPTTGGVTASFCIARGHYFSRAKCINWICRTKSDRTNNKTKITRRFSKIRIFARAWLYR